MADFLVRAKGNPMTMRNKDKIRALLKSIETGDPAPVAYVNEAKYIQHNPQTHEGSEGLAVLFERLSKTNPHVNIVRAFEDDDYVFAHTEYDFSRRNIGFEVFRFEDGQAVEHWDNIQKRLGPNTSGRSMVDGPTDALDHGNTKSNRRLVCDFIDTVLINGRHDTLGLFVSEALREHNPNLADGLGPLSDLLTAQDGDSPIVDYQTRHRVLAEGNFVLSVCEGYNAGKHTAFYDLLRIEDGMIVEHWDTTETVAPKTEWKNDNGKF